MNIHKIETRECTGCKMCADICPKSAISFKVNREGYWYPYVSDGKCVDCGLCLEKCPVRMKKTVGKRLAYAAWIKNEAVRRKSTSGGLYYAFAKEVIDDGGYIVGSTYTDDYCGAYHTYSDSLDGLNKIMGSKYFQSDTAGIFAKTSELLSGGRKVLFTGTPCQVMALKAFLGEEYENLITVDFICKGVPSPKMQKKKIELYEKKENSRITFYRDKSDKYAWSDFGEMIRFDNGKEKFISRWEDDINDCFVAKNLNLRESCYNCDIKGGNNASEVTIGDFWGIAGVTEKDYKLGVSALIINNDKGKQFIESLRDSIYLEQRNLYEVARGNPAYVASAERPDGREMFFESVDRIGLEKTVKKYTKKSLGSRFWIRKKLLKIRLRRFIPIFLERKNINWLKFIKYNYFCKSIVREKDAYIVPCKGAVIDIASSAKVYIRGNVFLNYYPCYRRGSQTTLFKVAENAEFVANNRVEISFGNTVSVADNAYLEMGHFFTGVNANVICHHKILIGNRVMIGRDVCIFDSDYHPIYDWEGNKLNDDREVIIDDNVWIGARSMILKGAHIKSGAIVSANTMVMGEVEENRVFINKRKSESVGGNIIWER